MSSGLLMLVSKSAFGGSILLILYIIYFEYKSAKANAEMAKIKLGEKENEENTASLSDEQLVDLVNTEFRSKPGDPTSKK